MKPIKSFDQAIADKATSLKDRGINSTAFWAYSKSIEAGNPLINFYEVIWDSDIEPIAEVFRENGITEFTISSTFSGLISTLAEFERHGFKVAGLTETNAPNEDWRTGQRARIPAIRMVTEEEWNDA